MLRLVPFFSVLFLVVFKPILTADATVRVLTYNIHHGKGVDGKLDLQRIANVITQSRADLVALQEVDRGVHRTERRDLPAELESLTGLKAVFISNRPFGGGEYGNAILSRWPILSITNHSLIMVTTNEPKGMLEVLVSTPGGELRFSSTHFDFRSTETNRLAQALQLKAMVEPLQPTATIVAGDFNALPESATYRLLTSFLRDAWTIAGSGPGYTFSSTDPRRRIDYVFFNGPLNPIMAKVLESDGSDHLPLLVEFKWMKSDPQK